ncbi:lytic transglycosylase domain-containing protein [bacterium]|jgi:soluble lytic murein transglycosylase|nr:lytic transglycosylase domain-containing protein [bacterium]
MKKEIRTSILKYFIISLPVGICALAAAVFLVSNTLFPVDYRKNIIETSNEYNVDPLLIAAIIFAESGYKREIISRAGAVGVMQLMPSTAAETAKKHHIAYTSGGDLTDIGTNIRLGTAHFADLLEYYDRDIRKSLAAYNAGKANVPRWLDGHGKLDISKIDFPETRKYVIKTGIYYNILRNIAVVYNLNAKGIKK